MDVQIHKDFTSVNIAELQDVYASVGWTKHTPDIIKRVFEASTHATIATNNNRVVGFGRALSDGVFNAAIYDVVVHSDYQSMGIGKLIIEDLLYNLRDVSCVHLISTTGNESFYRRLGLKKATTSMARYLNPAMETHYLE